jgi:hypothetical protein
MHGSSLLALLRLVQFINARGVDVGLLVEDFLNLELMVLLPVFTNIDS